MCKYKNQSYNSFLLHIVPILKIFFFFNGMCLTGRAAFAREAQATSVWFYVDSRVCSFCLFEFVD